jgi:hypothetical protein
LGEIRGNENGEVAEISRISILLLAAEIANVTKPLPCFEMDSFAQFTREVYALLASTAWHPDNADGLGHVLPFAAANPHPV